MKNHSDIWVIPFNYEKLTSQKLSTLNKEERKKSKKFFHIKDQKNYQLSHIYLREILSYYAPSIMPNIWEFEYNNYGKPTIAFKKYKNIHFNISHTHSHFAMIVSNNICGIDIEEDKNLTLDQTILELVLTSKEQDMIKRKEISFYTFWTLKEAHLKATGKGLSIPLKEIEFLSIKKNKLFQMGEYSYQTQKIHSNLYLSYAVLSNVDNIFITKSL